MQFRVGNRSRTICRGRIVKLDRKMAPKEIVGSEYKKERVRMGTYKATLMHLELRNSRSISLFKKERMRQITL